MPLQKQIFVIPLGQGLQRQISEHVLPPEALEKAQNITFWKEGGFQRTARTFSFANQGTGNSRAIKLFTHKTQLGALTMTGFLLKSGSSFPMKTGGNATAARAVYPRRRDIANTYDTVANIDMALVGGKVVAAWNVLTTNGIIKGPVYGVYDTQFNTIAAPVETGLQNSGFTTETMGLKVLKIASDKVGIITASSTILDANHGKPYLQVYNTTTSTLGAKIPFLDNEILYSTGMWDACPVVGGTATGFWISTLRGAAKINTAGGTVTAALTGIPAEQNTAVRQSSDSGNRVMLLMHPGSAGSFMAKVFTSAGATLGTTTLFVDRTGATTATGFFTTSRMVVGAGSTVSRFTVGISMQSNTISGKVYHYTEMFEVADNYPVTIYKHAFIYHHVLTSKPFLATYTAYVNKDYVKFGMEYVAPHAAGDAADNFQRHAFLCTIVPNPEGTTTSTVPTFPRMGGATAPTGGNGRSPWLIVPVAKYATEVASTMAFGTLTLPETITLTYPADTDYVNGHRFAFGSLVMRRQKDKAAAGAGIVVSGTYKDVDPSTGFYQTLGASVWEFEMARRVPAQVHVTDATLLPLGLVSSFDGNRITEESINYQPELLGKFRTTGTTTYLVKGQYEYQDAAGRIHRSAPSFALTCNSMSTAGTLYVYLPDPAWMLTATRQTYGNKIYPKMYRTVGGKTGLFFLAEGANTGFVTPLYGVTEMGGGVIRTAINMAVANTHELFSESGERSPVPQPGFVDMVVSKNRVWGISAENRSEVWASKWMSAGQAVEWNLEFFVAAGDDHDGFERLAAFDDKIVAFGKKGIYYIYGDGPNNNGVGGGFAGPIPIPNSLGLVSRASVAFGEFGCLFQSSAGATLLTRDLQIQYVGQPIKDFLGSDNPTITVIGAQVDPQSRHVFWFLGSTASAVGTMTHQPTGLLWNYDTNKWSSLYEPNATDAITHSGVQYLLSENKLRYRETVDRVTVSAVTSGSQGRNILAETGWIHPASIDGFVRCHSVTLMAKNFESGKTSPELPTHPGGQLRIKLFFNGTTSDYSDTFTLTKLSEHPEEIRLKMVPSIRKFESIKIRIEDVITDYTASANSRGWLRPYAIALEVGVNQGKYPYHNSNQRK